MKLQTISENKIECSQPILGNHGNTCQELGRDCPFIRLKIRKEDGYIEHYKVYVKDISYARIIYNRVNSNKYPYKNTIQYINKLEKDGSGVMVKLLDRQEALWPQNRDYHHKPFQ